MFLMRNLQQRELLSDYRHVILSSPGIMVLVEPWFQKGGFAGTHLEKQKLRATNYTISVVFAGLSLLEPVK